MKDPNVLLLVGRLVRDPEIKFTSGDLAITKFSIANNKGKKDNEDLGASFFYCVCFGKTAEVVNKYCEKGRKVLIEGAIDQSRWIDRQGKKQNMVKVIAHRVTFLDNGRPKDDSVTAPTTSEQSQQEEPSGESPPPDDDDIPF